MDIRKRFEKSMVSMRKESYNKPICLCCQNLRAEKINTLFCKSCSIFLHKRLRLTKEFISNKIYNNDRKNVRMTDQKCTLCGDEASIIYKHLETKKKYYLCKYHHQRWLTIGCEIAEFIKMLE